MTFPVLGSVRHALLPSNPSRSLKGPSEVSVAWRSGSRDQAQVTPEKPRAETLALARSVRTERRAALPPVASTYRSTTLLASGVISARVAAGRESARAAIARAHRPHRNAAL